MEYKNYYFDNKELINHRLSIGDPKIISETIVGMINGIDDCSWLTEKCLAYLDHVDFGVAKNAITGLGDIARIYGRLEDVDKVKIALNKIEREDLKGYVEDTLSDFKVFLEG